MILNLVLFVVLAVANAVKDSVAPSLVGTLDLIPVPFDDAAAASHDLVVAQSPHMGLSHVKLTHSNNFLVELEAIQAGNPEIDL